jgi:hypothetical protein
MALLENGGAKPFFKPACLFSALNISRFTM